MSQPHDEQETFEALNAYLECLHAGQRPDRRQLIQRHPELASVVDCLEALEALAPRTPVEVESKPAELKPAQAKPPTAKGLSLATIGLPEAGEAAPTEPAGTLPRDFGPYLLLEEIGRGGMGVVYKARQRGLDRIVAIKMILASHLASPDHVRRFQAEARSAARLRHPHIVHIHEVGQLHGQHYFTMEYVEGENLAQRMARGAMDPHAGADLLVTVARAVEHLHRQGVVHRDLKPSNILVDTEGRPYVTDFGLAKVFAPGSEMTATGVIAGTPAYMSPEQASGHTSEVGPAADVYSLGAILYEILTGEPPFRAESLFDTLMQVLGSEPTGPRQLNPRIPRELEMVCLKCLAKSPEARYASAAALADDLEHFLRGEALAVKPPSLGQLLWRWTRRKPALASRLGALGLFYLVGLTNYWLGNVDADFHRKTSILVVIWVAVSIGCQQFLASRRWSLPAQFLWGGLDSALFLAVLLVANGVASPLVVGYPLLIAGSALWFRVRFVWFMTTLSLVSYGVLVWDFYHRRIELQQGFDTSYSRHVIFVLGLIVMGLVIAYLVQRVRLLSAYYGRRDP